MIRCKVKTIIHFEKKQDKAIDFVKIQTFSQRHQIYHCSDVLRILKIMILLVCNALETLAAIIKTVFIDELKNMLKSEWFLEECNTRLRKNRPQGFYKGKAAIAIISGKNQEKYSSFIAWVESVDTERNRKNFIISIWGQQKNLAL